MKILLINPPYLTLTSRLGTGHQIPLGLLMVGGPLLDAGHEVQLLDAECHHLSTKKILSCVQDFAPDVVMTGHAGSTSAHPTCAKMLSAIKRTFPQIVTVYGGVYPSFNAEEILRKDDGIDVIVCGEGEAVSLNLVTALESGQSLDDVKGIVFRRQGQPRLTPLNPPISDLDSYRIGWELVQNWDDYQCFGLGRAAVIQFSRGCPHCCTFCGQQEFWKKWRHRDPVKVADEIEWLYRKHNVRFFSLADENPTTIKVVWRNFLEEMVARKMQVHFFASIRTTDIVRDVDILHLYKQAGIQYVLLGIESVAPEVLKNIKKGSTPRLDLKACRLMKKHNIFSILAHVVGLKEETWKTFRTALKQLVYYNGDFVNVTYVTPHNWTAFGRQVRGRPVVQKDLSKWDYRHQILGQSNLSPWKIFLAVKWMEFCFHLRPRKLWAILKMKDRSLRRQLLWSLLHTGLVWLAELLLLKMTRPSHAHTAVSDDGYSDMAYLRRSISSPPDLASAAAVYKPASQK